MTADIRSRRIGFFTGRQVASEGGVLYAESGIGRVLDTLHHRCDLLVAACMPAERQAKHNQRLDLPATRLLPLPPMASIVAGIPRSRPCRAVMADLEGRTDLTIVQLSFQSPLALAPQSNPRLYHLFGDVYELARVSNRYTGPRRLPAVALGAAVQQVQQRAVRRRGCSVVTNGEPLAAKYRSGRTRSVVSSTLSATELPAVLPPDRDPSRPPRLLFVGYARPEKGFDTLLDAFEVLLGARHDATLTLVVRGDIDSAEPRVARRFRELEADGRVEILGELPFGPELFAVYERSDVLLLPSRSEGTPRVLVEARAFGCPVVSTTVGGIPSSVADGVDGLLVEPDDPGGLAAAAHRLLTDATLRARIRAAGFERAHGLTVEAFVDTLLEELAALDDRTTRT